MSRLTRAEKTRIFEELSALVAIEGTSGDDFVGVQTYSRSRVGPDGRTENEDGVPALPMGYEFYPQALEATLRRAWEVTGGELPLLVTENGTVRLVPGATSVTTLVPASGPSTI